MGQECKRSNCILLKEKEREILQLNQEINALKKQASIDQMTGFLNKCEGIKKLKDEMKKNLRDNTNTTIAFIDIDRFKLVNDRLGHCTGDQLLVELSKILLTNIRKEDFIIRFGGDEFIIVFTSITKLQAKEVWKRVYKAIEGFNKESNFIFPISLSIGFYEYDSCSDLDVNQFIHLADSEMYREKQQKRKGL
ncbi:GGDEF domain-containing protein [Alkaliphilus peptidifermentans]|uniref:Diguanylate cyclase (GGDEF) domain-containing protein n=1 Tax=Alkaliphilus peptidifermentans DSM 18978 TaxID=1120976 RepID=A0A1G5EBC1_9FIRM|nr:GGDEF domain-containing protein [Alkaliphilus peptidifermentans]SCY24289.1 diguanylate cyclase (GGDEF) domain-containing protein [Alkaliphilus peptidifermentans DSM 18978]